MGTNFHRIDLHLQRELQSPCPQQQKTAGTLAEVAPWAVAGGGAGVLLGLIVDILRARSQPVARVLSQEGAGFSVPLMADPAAVRHEVDEDAQYRRRLLERLMQEEEKKRKQEEAAQEKQADDMTLVYGPPVAALSALASTALVASLLRYLRRAGDKARAQEERDALQASLNEKQVLLQMLRDRLKSEKLAQAVVEELEQLVAFEVPVEKAAASADEGWGPWLDNVLSGAKRFAYGWGGITAAAFTTALLLRAINAYRKRRKEQLTAVPMLDKTYGIEMVTPEEKEYGDVLRELEQLYA